MFRRVICWVAFVLLLSLSGGVSADVSWNDSAGDHLSSYAGIPWYLMTLAVFVVVSADLS